MTERSTRTRSPLPWWRGAGLSLVVLAIVLAATGLILAILHARSLTDHLIAQAEPQARQLVATFKSLFDEKIRAALHSVNDDQRLPSKYPSWRNSDFPWIDGLYLWDGTRLKTVAASTQFGDALGDLLAARLANRAMIPLSNPSSADIELIHGKLDEHPVCIATMRTRGEHDHPVIVAANIHLERLKNDLVQPLLDMSLGLLERVPNDTNRGPDTFPLAGPMRDWSIRPTRKFLAEQEEIVQAQTLIYTSLTVLSLVAVLAAMWLMMRLVRREISLATMKSNFVADVSHELKTPLALIRLFGETLQSGRVREESKRQEYYGVITRESTRLTNLINNILDFARIEAGKKEYSMQPTDVAAVIRETYEAYMLELDHNGFTHSLSVETGLPCVLADRDAIARAALNLINNAIKYSSEECYLHIDVRGDTRRGRHGVLISFEDHGIGIRPEDRQHLFEGFFRSPDARVRSKRGTGLGLSLVKHIVDAHGGYLDVESRLVKGTTFRIFLPAMPAEAA